MSNYMTHSLSHKYSNWACDNQSSSRFVTVLIVMVIINLKKLLLLMSFSWCLLCLHAGCSDKEGKVEVSQSKIMEGKRKKILKYDWKKERKKLRKIKTNWVHPIVLPHSLKNSLSQERKLKHSFWLFFICIMLYKNWWHSFYSVANFKGCFFAVLCNRSTYMSVFLIGWKM